MLIEFSVSNFRSIHHRQSISMVPGSSRHVKNRFSHSTSSKDFPHVLRASGIFGPNGSGKSALVRAMDFMRDFVVNSARKGQEGDLIAVVPFLFSQTENTEPSEFEAVFVMDNVRYQYGFTATSGRVHDEWLYVVPASGRMQRWFERTYDPKTAETNWYINQSIRGEREVWRKSTRDNALFLSSAIQLKSDYFRPVFDWFQKNFRIISSSQRLGSAFSAKLCKNPEQRHEILNVLNSVDVGLSDIEIKEEEFSEDHIPNEIPDAIRADIIKKMKGTKFHDIKTIRKVTDRGSVCLDLDEESDGTKVLFSLAGPWLDVLKNGYTLVVDELSNSLHPLAFQYLVNLINGPNNKSGAQLIFTTHDTTILAGKQLHPDQINLIEKNAAFETEIIPLSDFEVRSDEAIQKGYLGGRYGGLPLINSGLI